MQRRVEKEVKRRGKRLCGERLKGEGRGTTGKSDTEGEGCHDEPRDCRTFLSIGPLLY